MKRFNYEQYIDKYRRNYKISLTIFIALLLLFVGIFLLGIFSANYKDRVIYMIIYSIVLSIIAISDSIVFIFYVLFYKKQLKELYYILGGYLVPLKGKVIEIKNLITTVSGRKGIEIVLQDGDNIFSVYLDELFKDKIFNVGDLLTIKVSESFIIQYEVKHA